MILYIQHIDIEGPETIGAFFQKKGFSGRVISLDRGERLPESLDGVDAVVVLGGPMNVYEEGAYPFLKEENLFIQQVVAHRVPFLGICLGAQLLAKACGAKVTSSPVREIGWRTVSLTTDGRMDLLFAGLPKELRVYQWHGDTFAIPAKGQWLAVGPDCPHQALKAGANAYGLQFHVEITDRSIREWSDAYFQDPLERDRQKAAMLAEYQQNKKDFEAAAEKIYHNFLQIIVSAQEQAR